MKMLCKLQFTVGPTNAYNTGRFRSAAAVWIVMAVITMTSSLARAECIGTVVELDKGEAALRCSLTVNVKATRHSIVIQYFPKPESSSEDIMDCHWPTEEAKDPECHSKYSFSLGSQLTDQVVAKVPVSSLNGSGTFKYQLVPPNNDQSSTGCQIYHFRDNIENKSPDDRLVPDEDEQPVVTGTPVVSPDSSDRDTPDQEPLKKETSHCGRKNDPMEMTGAILGLQIIICLLVAADVLIIQCQKNQRLSAASLMGREWPTENREGNCDFPDQRRTRGSETKRRKSSHECPCNKSWTWSAAAVWIMMALTVATSSLAGAEYVGTDLKLDKGEAALMCHLPVDVRNTRHSIIVKHFPIDSNEDEVLHCHWPTADADEPECESNYSFSLVAPLTDQVVAKMPVSRLMDSGAYKCQLYPPDYQRPFTPCHIYHFSDNAATDRCTPGQDPLDRPAPPSEEQSGSVALTAAVLVLQVIIIILLVVNFLYLQTKKNLQKPVMSEEEPMNSLERQAASQSPPEPPPSLSPHLEQLEP